MHGDRPTGEHLQTWDDVWLIASGTAQSAAQGSDVPATWSSPENTLGVRPSARVWKTWDDIGIAEEIGETAPDRPGED